MILKSNFAPRRNGVAPAPVPDVRTRTRDAVDVLAQDVQADLADVEALLDRALGLVTQLERDTRIIIGLSPSCRGWRLQLERMVEDLREERDSIPRRVQGGGPGLVVSVDERHAERVLDARARRRSVLLGS